MREGIESLLDARDDDRVEAELGWLPMGKNLYVNVDDLIALLRAGDEALLAVEDAARRFSISGDSGPIPAGALAPLRKAFLRLDALRVREHKRQLHAYGDTGEALQAYHEEADARTQREAYGEPLMLPWLNDALAFAIVHGYPKEQGHLALEERQRADAFLSKRGYRAVERRDV